MFAQILLRPTVNTAEMYKNTQFQNENSFVSGNGCALQIDVYFSLLYFTTTCAFLFMYMYMHIHAHVNRKAHEACNFKTVSKQSFS